MPDLASTYGEGLARLVQVPTVTGSDRQNFVNFRKVLAEEFPAVYRVCDVIRPATAEKCEPARERIFLLWRRRLS